jgi:hypothetical protein
MDKTRMADQVPESTVDGQLPDYRCENCRYWGKGNGMTVCRFTPGVPALVRMGAAGETCISLYPPKLPNEWCGNWKSGKNGMPHGSGPLS